MSNTYSVINIDKKTGIFLRGFAALFVLIAHYSEWYGRTVHTNFLIRALGTAGRYGVAVFLFLSAYGLTLSAKKGITPVYFWKRISTLYIPYLLIRTLYVLVWKSEITKEVLIDLFCSLENWYVCVAMLLYILFYIAQKLGKTPEGKLLILTGLVFVLSVILAFIGNGDYWYLSNITFVMGAFWAEAMSADGNRLKGFSDRLFAVFFVPFRTKKHNVILSTLCTGIVFVACFGLYCILEAKEMMIYQLFKFLVSIVFVNLFLLLIQWIDITKLPLSFVWKFMGTLSLEFYLSQRVFLGLFVPDNGVLSIVLAVAATAVFSYLFNKLYNKLIKLIPVSGK